MNAAIPMQRYAGSIPGAILGLLLAIGNVFPVTFSGTITFPPGTFGNSGGGAPIVSFQLTNASTKATFLAKCADMTLDEIWLAAGDYVSPQWEDIEVNVDRTARPLTIRVAPNANVTFSGPAGTTGSIFWLGQASFTKWITFDGHDASGGGSWTFRNFLIASSGVFEPRGTDHCTFKNLTFQNLGRDGVFAPNPRNSWCFYISGAGAGGNTNLLIDRCTFKAPAVSRDISCIQIASSGSHSNITITNVLEMTNYSYGIYDERPTTNLQINGVVMVNTGDGSGPASINMTGAVNISGTIQNVTGTGGCLPYRDVHSGGGVINTANISIV